MTNKKINHSAALSQLGNLFQYLIALRCALEAKPTDIINIESLGDLTMHDVNYEIKHHQNPEHCLIDSHIDLWKTLANWVTHKEALSDYSHKILLTSSIVKEGTLAHDWNNLTPEERYEELEKLKIKFLSDDSKYKTIKPHILKIFNFTIDYTKDDFVDLIKNVTIKHSQSVAIKLYQELFYHSKLDVIKEKDRFPIILSLIGFILDKGITSPKNWDIEVSEFIKFLREQVYKISSGEKPTFPDLEYQTLPEEDLSNKRFIEQIRKIPFEEQVIDAGRCYHYSLAVLTRMALQNPHALKEFDKDTTETGTVLNNSKKEFCLSFEDEDTNLLKRRSKRHYLKSINNIKIKQNYPPDFNKGLIHQYVDNSNFEWKLKESDFED